MTGDSTARDLRESWRALRRRPGFLATRSLDLVLAGVAVGLWLTMNTIVWLGMFMVDVHDAVLFGSVAATLFVIVVAAALIPGIRATQIDPIEALRPE